MKEPKALSRPKPLLVRMTPQELVRFLFFIHVGKPFRKLGPCWLWTGHKDKKGYGQFKLRGRAMWAHRLSFVTFRHCLRAIREVDHKCKNPSCVNPQHLRRLTHERNSAHIPF